MHARIRTALISTYRVHPKKYFKGGANFPDSWPKNQIKERIDERYSPAGTIGFYFGLTLDAALDEAKYYDPLLNIAENQSHFLMVHRTYYYDLLYLTPVLGTVWSYLDLPAMDNTWDMYRSIMDPTTNNEITNQIGLWAREEGFRGIVYPSARYGQRNISGSQNKQLVFPALNFVEIGSHLCEQGVAMHMTLNELANTLTDMSATDSPPSIVYSEPNLVIFDEDAVAGRDRPVFYSTYGLNESEFVRNCDEREGLKNQIKISYEKNGIALHVDHSEYTFRAEASRESGPGEPKVFSEHHSKTPEMRMGKLRKSEFYATIKFGNGPRAMVEAKQVKENFYILTISRKLEEEKRLIPTGFYQNPPPVEITIEGNPATYVHSSTMHVTREGDIIIQAIMDPSCAD